MGGGAGDAGDRYRRSGQQRRDGQAEIDAMEAKEARVQKAFEIKQKADKAAYDAKIAAEKKAYDKNQKEISIGRAARSKASSSKYKSGGTRTAGGMMSGNETGRRSLMSKKDDDIKNTLG